MPHELDQWWRATGSIGVCALELYVYSDFAKRRPTSAPVDLNIHSHSEHPQPSKLGHLIQTNLRGIAARSTERWEIRGTKMKNGEINRCRPTRPDRTIPLFPAVQARIIWVHK